jgi:hypothetical protein
VGGFPANSNPSKYSPGTSDTLLIRNPKQQIITVVMRILPNHLPLPDVDFQTITKHGLGLIR